jgi:hypothetical protein
LKFKAATLSESLGNYTEVTSQAASNSWNWLRKSGFEKALLHPYRRSNQVLKEHGLSPTTEAIGFLKGTAGRLGLQP